MTEIYHNFFSRNRKLSISLRLGMASDLVLNFAPESSSSAPAARVKPKVKSGRWQDRVRQNRRLKGNANRPKETVQASREVAGKQPSLGETTPREDNIRPSKKPRTADDSRTHLTEAEHPVTESSQHSNQLVISSLFSSLPETHTTHQDQTFKAYAPTNGPSDISLTSLRLQPDLLAHLTASSKLSLSHQTPIQRTAIPHLINQSPSSPSADALVQAETGSGKTLAYLIPIINDLVRISSGKSWTREVGTLAIILVPTKELAVQVLQVVQDILSFKGDHTWCVPGMLTGGTTRSHEKARLRKGLPILVSTPGRLIDHLQTTTSFRIAGDPARTSKASNPAQSGQLPSNVADEDFEVEDRFEPGQGGNRPAGDDSSDDSIDFKLHKVPPTSRSHRSAKTQKAHRRKKAAVSDSVDSDLTLRWLVLDEADRLLDMGFEPQVASILQSLEARNRMSARNKGSNTEARRRTILCSATVDSKVQSLAGMTLKNPTLIKPLNGSDASLEADSNTSPKNTGSSFKAPAQLDQSFIITPSKLRFVVLVALLRKISKLAKQVSEASRACASRKVVVFVSCTDVVDLLFEALGGLDMRRDSLASEGSKSGQESPERNRGYDKLEKNSMILPRTKVYKLHGNMDIQTRLGTLRGFSADNFKKGTGKNNKKPDDESAEFNGEEGEQSISKVLICTSVAARGLDIPSVGAVIQYDLPTEGGLKEYIHRVGRTARAGGKGESWAIVLPEEKDWVEWVRNSDQEVLQGSENESKAETSEVTHSPLRDVSLDDTLENGFGGSLRKDWESRATDVQMAFERWVLADTSNTELARKAFSSHVRAYATHPGTEKHIFHVRNLHLGHLAKSFGLREAPSHSNSSSKSHSSSKKVSASRSKTSQRKASSQATHSGKKHDSFRNNKRSTGKLGNRASQHDEFNVASTDALENMLKMK